MRFVNPFKVLSAAFTPHKMYNVGTGLDGGIVKPNVYTDTPYTHAKFDSFEQPGLNSAYSKTGSESPSLWAAIKNAFTGFVKTGSFKATPPDGADPLPDGPSNDPMFYKNATLEETTPLLLDTDDVSPFVK